MAPRVAQHQRERAGGFEGDECMRFHEWVERGCTYAAGAIGGREMGELCGNRGNGDGVILWQVRGGEFERDRGIRG